MVVIYVFLLEEAMYFIVIYVYLLLVYVIVVYVLSMYSMCCLCILCVVYVFLDAATLTEGFPCFSPSCKANVRV